MRQITVTLGDASYRMTVASDRVEASRERQVGGIAIKREPLDPGQWVTTLTADLREQAQRSAEARAALERLMR